MTMIKLTLLAALGVLCALIQPASAQGAGRVPVITGVSGCQDQSPTQTINCPRPVELTITGSGFTSGLENVTFPWNSIKIKVITPDPAVSYECKFDWDTMSGPPSDTRLVCTLNYAAFGAVIVGKLFAIQYTNEHTDVTASLPGAISFAVEQPPRVDRVSGCRIVASDGRSTSECSLLEDYITIHGAHFSSVDHSLAMITLGSVSRTWYMGASTVQPIVRYSDTEIVFNFARSSFYITGIDAYNGAPLALLMKDSTNARIWSTEPVYVSFLHLPDPDIRSIEPFGKGCTIDNSTSPTRFVDCLHYGASLSVRGAYFFQPISVSVAGQPCQLSRVSATEFDVTLPAFESAADVFYDLTITSPVGFTTVPSLIQFNQIPLIWAVQPCIDTADDAGKNIHCRPSDTLTVKTVHINHLTTPHVWLVQYGGPEAIQTECPNVKVFNDGTISCPMPANPTDRDTGRNGVYLQWDNGFRTTEFSLYNLWDPVHAPRLTSLSGCQSNSNDPLHLNQCLGQPTEDIVLTIHGVNLQQPNARPWDIYIGTKSTAIKCLNQMNVSSTRVECLLPRVETDTGSFRFMFDTKYLLKFTGYDGRQGLIANMGYITYVQDIHNGSPSSGSTNATTIALATVFSIIGVAMMVVGLYMAKIRQNHKKRPGNDSFGPELSSNGGHIEMNDV